MRVLAHYTVIGKEVFTLHVSDIRGTSEIRHCPVEGETAHTLFLSGILAVCSAAVSVRNLEELDRLVADCAGMPMASVAASVAGYLESESLSFSDGRPFALLKMEFPYRKAVLMPVPD